MAAKIIRYDRPYNMKSEGFRRLRPEVLRQADAVVAEGEDDILFLCADVKADLSGETTVKAVTENASDEVTFRKVMRPNPEYRLKKSKGKSANWV